MSKNHVRGIAAPYSVSQNYITSARLVKRLLSLTDINKGDLVVEIGPGKGHITKELAGACRHVNAVEIDKKHYDRLCDLLAGIPNLSLSNADFLHASLPQDGYKVFSNIPFNKTTDIMRKLAFSASAPEAAWLVMEKGAAKRFSGLPGENRMSLALKPFFDTKIIYHFSKQDFHPAPSVDCVLLRMTRKPVPDLELSMKGKYERFVDGSLKHGVSRFLTKKQVSTALRLAKLPDLPESGNMLYVQWLCLFRCYRAFGNRENHG